MEILLYPLAFLLLLGVIVVFHEFGHSSWPDALACMSSDFLWGYGHIALVGQIRNQSY